MGIVWVIAVVELIACNTPSRDFEIRRRDPGDRTDAEEQGRAYAEEFAYVRARRSQLDGARPDVEPMAESAAPMTAAPVTPQPVDLPPSKPPLPPPPPSNVIGLALSGGGIRSATIGLGFLQGLEKIEVLDQIDYTSAVSGGGYIAGWQQAHLGARPALERDEFAFLVGAPNPEELLRSHDDHVEQLRTHSGFLNQGGWVELPTIVWQWLWRWPFHIVMDDIIHLRGVFTFQHIFPIYQQRIEGTYYRGTPPSDALLRPISETRLVDVNAAGSEKLTPYLVLNATLTNRGPSRMDVKLPQFPGSPKVGAPWSFEFTRDFVGSDATGYVASGGFGLPVENVVEGKARHWKKDDEPPIVPRKVRVKLKDAEKSPFRLSEASSAAGAAFDSLAAAQRMDVLGLSEGMHLLGGAVLNLNLGLDVPNFSREYDGGWAPLDYARMFTYQRVPRHTDPGARWLHITDGGHYENLGIYALLRRGATCIVSVDAGADPDGTFEDLWSLSRRVGELGFVWASPLPDQQNAPHYRFELTDADGSVRAVVLLLKASVDARFPHMVEYTDELAQRVLQTSIDAVSGNLVQAVAALRAQLERAAGTKLTGGAPPLAELEALSHKSFKSTKESDEAIKKLRRELEEIGISQTARSAELKQLRARRIASTSAVDPTVDSAQSQQEATITPAEAEREAELNADVAAAANEQRRIEAEIAKLKLSREQLAEFKAKVADASGQLETELGSAPIGMSPDAAKRWADRFNAVLVRGGERLYELSQMSLDPEANQEARNDRIRRIRAYSRMHREFPHTPTLRQWYEWEDFEAYRLLGIQMSTTYLRPLSPGTESTKPLAWCDFPNRFAASPVSAGPPQP